MARHRIPHLNQTILFHLDIALRHLSDCCTNITKQCHLMHFFRALLLSPANRLDPVSPQATYMHPSSSASSLSTGFSRTPSSESLFFHFDDLFAHQTARNVELETMNLSEVKRRRRPSLARRLSRLFGPQPQPQQEDKVLPGIHKSRSQPQFGQKRLEGYATMRPLHSCSTVPSQRSSCSSEELSDASSGKNSSSESSFSDIFGRFDRVPMLHPPLIAEEEEDRPIYIKSGQRALLSRTLPRSLQRQISRKKILDSLFEEPRSPPNKFRGGLPEPPSEPAVITPVHGRVRKPGMVMSLSRAELVRNLLTAENGDSSNLRKGCDDAMLKNLGCDDFNDGCEEGDLCDDVIDDEDMKDIFEKADGNDDQVVPEVKEEDGCEEEEDDIERARRKIEKKVLVIFDGDQLPTNKGVMLVRRLRF